MIGTGLAWQTDDCGNAKRMIAGRDSVSPSERSLYIERSFGGVPGRGHSPGEGARGSPSMSI